MPARRLIFVHRILTHDCLIRSKIYAVKMHSAEQALDLAQQHGCEGQAHLVNEFRSEVLANHRDSAANARSFSDSMASTMLP